MTHAPSGWRCTIGRAHDGPCPLVPRWWNLGARLRYSWHRGAMR